jgi:hypothetical protein
VRYTAASNTNVKGKKIGNTITGIATAGGQRLISGDTSIRAVQIVEIVKGSPNFTLSVIMNNSSSTPADTSSTHLKTALESESMAAAVTYLNTLGVGAYVRVASANSALAVSEATDGYLDAVCVAWDRDFPACYVSEVLFAKVA